MIALVFASLFAQSGGAVKGAGFYRIVYFFPQVMPVVVVGTLWSYVYQPNSGLLNGILRNIGLDGLGSTSWLTDGNTALWAIVAVTIWSSVGFYMVIFLASMQSIPTSFYEAATLDGATSLDLVPGHHVSAHLGVDPYVVDLSGHRRA